MADRTLHLVAPDPEWPAKFARIRDRVEPALADVACRVEHVGSTSVPGLWAKPIIDMTVVIERAEDLPRVVGMLVGVGYEHIGDLGVTGREAFRHPDDDPSHNLYAGHKDAAAIRNHLTLRDTLRASHELIDQYSTLKKTLAQRHAGDIEAYTRAKTGFITEVLASSGFDATELEQVRHANRA